MGEFSASTGIKAAIYTVPKFYHYALVTGSTAWAPFKAVIIIYIRMKSDALIDNGREILPS